MMGRLLGHKVKVCVPETVFPEIPRLLLAYGAEVVWVPAPLGIKSALEEARRLGSLPGHFLTDQFGNEANVRAHYETTAAEILADLPRVDAFVSGIGTGGTITGVGRRLKEANPACRVVGVEPRLGSHVQGLQSLDQGYIPPILDLGLLDGKIIVSSRHAFRHAREAMAREGILAGISAGACLHAAVRTARRMREGNLVTVFADGGWKYLGSSLWDAEPSAENVEDDYDDVLWW
jgi:cysteine synthase B